MTGKLLLWITLRILLGVRLTPAEECLGPFDLEGDSAVGLGDWTLLARCLGGVDITAPPLGCDPVDFAAADVDNDGDVDLRDCARFSSAFGAEYFDYGPHRTDTEAERLAIEISGQLRAPDDLYNRIHRDLQLIRAVYPEVVDVRDFPAYVPREIVVKLIDGVPIDGYASLNEHYIVVSEQINPLFRTVTFCDVLNMPVIAEQYDALPEAQYAQPIGFGGDGDDIIVTPLCGTYRYAFYRGYGDCLSGCMCNTIWMTQVDAGGAVGPISCMDTCVGECP